MSISRLIKRRAVITGLGPITPVGIGKHSYWDSIIYGRTNFREPTRFSPEKYKTKIVAEIDTFVPQFKRGELSSPPENFTGLNVGDYINSRTIRKIENLKVDTGGWTLYYAIAAAKLAINDSGLDLADEDLSRIGNTVSSSSGDLQLIRHSQPSYETTQYGTLGGISGTISHEFGLQGIGIPLAGACASATLSMRSGYMEILSEQQDVVLVGSVSAGLVSDDFFAACDKPKLGPMSKNNDYLRPAKPFDVDRGGYILGEGAGVLVLEDLDHALARNAHIYAEVVGFGHNTDTASHLADITLDGYSKAMRSAVKNAGLTDNDFANSNVHINAHGTGTVKNDQTESHAISEVFGTNTKKIHVNSIKGTTGHAQEAASAHELIASALVLDKGIIPFTNGLEILDPKCADLNYVSGESREVDVDYIIKNSAGYCGAYCTAVMKKFEL